MRLMFKVFRQRESVAQYKEEFQKGKKVFQEENSGKNAQKIAEKEKEILMFGQQDSVVLNKYIYNEEIVKKKEYFNVEKVSEKLKVKEEFHEE